MSAALKEMSVWDRIAREITFEHAHERDVDPKWHADITPGDAARYVVELGESMADCLANTLIEAVEDPRLYPRLNNALTMLMHDGDAMPAAARNDVLAVLRDAMTEHMRGRLKRRIERELA